MVKETLSLELLASQIAELTEKVEKLTSENETLSEKVENLTSENETLSEKVEKLTSENETLSEKVEKLAAALKESTVQREVEVVETPVDISTLSFAADKTTYKFARPSVSIEEGGKFVTYKASEVAEDKKLQAKFAEMAANGQTTFVVAQK